MDRYIEQLVNDIYDCRKKDTSSSNPQSFEEEMEEIERYVSEDPVLTLGQNIKLDTSIFPPKEKLTDSHCQQLVEALAEIYFSYAISLGIPDDIPIDIKYEFYVDALDKKMFMFNYGMLHVEYCNYDFSVCPFGVSNCTCFKDWEKEVKKIHKIPEAHWNESQLMETVWYDFLYNYDLAKSEFESCDSPTKAEVNHLLTIIRKATLLFIRKEGVIHFNPDKSELPANPVFKQIFEWMGFDKLSFPPWEELSDIEVEIVGYELLKLYGKDEIAISLLSIADEKRYSQLVLLFTDEMTMGNEMQFFFRHKEIYPHELPDLLAGLNLDIFDADDMMSEEEELPF